MMEYKEGKETEVEKDVMMVVQVEKEVMMVVEVEE